MRLANITAAVFYIRKLIKIVIYAFFHLQVFRPLCITPYILPSIVILICLSRLSSSVVGRMEGAVLI